MYRNVEYMVETVVIPVSFSMVFILHLHQPVCLAKEVSACAEKVLLSRGQRKIPAFVAGRRGGDQSARISLFPNLPHQHLNSPESSAAPTLLPLTRNCSADLDSHGPPPWLTTPKLLRQPATVVVVAAVVAAETPLPLVVLMSRALLAMEPAEEASPAVAEVEALVDVISNGTKMDQKIPRNNPHRRLRLRLRL